MEVETMMRNAPSTEGRSCQTRAHFSGSRATILASTPRIPVPPLSRKAHRKSEDSEGTFSEGACREKCRRKARISTELFRIGLAEKVRSESSDFQATFFKPGFSESAPRILAFADSFCQTPRPRKCRRNPSFSSPLFWKALAQKVTAKRQDPSQAFPIMCPKRHAIGRL